MSNNLTQAQLSQLQKLNLRLKNMQDKILKEIEILDSQLIKRVEDKNDFLDDYELEVNISFYIKENDVNYKEDEDNIITNIEQYVKKISLGNKHFWTGNHNEFTSWENHIMKDEYHCYWYHCLYDHNNLSFEDILNIGRIWVDIKTYYQYFEEEEK